VCFRDYNTGGVFLGWRGFVVIKSQSNPEPAMKVHVVGAGSIGKRRLQEPSALRRDETFYWVIRAVGKGATAFASGPIRAANLREQRSPLDA
jgi:hypothetical protein